MTVIFNRFAEDEITFQRIGSSSCTCVLVGSGARAILKYTPKTIRKAKGLHPNEPIRRVYAFPSDTPEPPDTEPRYYPH
jgi:hypothetical protein